jgi:hypothetical protein
MFPDISAIEDEDNKLNIISVNSDDKNFAELPRAIV